MNGSKFPILVSAVCALSVPIGCTGDRPHFPLRSLVDAGTSDDAKGDSANNTVSRDASASTASSDQTDVSSAPRTSEDGKHSDASDATCTEDSDCSQGVCASGQCVSCQPEDMRCAAAEAEQWIEVCSGAGSWQRRDDCEAPTSICLHGQCVACDPDSDTYRCNGGNSMSCSESGNWVLNDECGGDTPACLPSTGRCGSCAEGELVCIDQETSGVCNASGAFLEEQCPYACVENACGGECSPDSLRCGNTGTPEECDGSGTWSPLPECDAGQACDTDTGECIGVPTIVEFSADAPSVTSGTSTTLTWDVVGADEVSISPDIGASSKASAVVSPTQTTTYTLTATNEAGNTTATARIAVVSAGTVVSTQHYVSASSGAYRILVDETNERLVTLNSMSSPAVSFMGVHSLQTGELESQSDVLSIGRASGFARIQSNFLVVSGKGEVLVLNDNFVELDSDDSFRRLAGGALEIAPTDVAITSDATGYVVGGLSRLSDDGFIASVVPDSLGEVSYELSAAALSALAIDSSDRLFVGGYGFMGRFSTSNLATPTNTATLDADDQVWDVAVDSAGSVLAVGTFSTGGFVAKFGPDLGDPMWRVSFIESQASTPRAVTVDSADNVFVAGSAGTDPDNQDIVVDALKADGTTLWSRIHLSASSDASAHDVVADTRGNVFVVGGASAALSDAVGYTGDEGAFIMHVQ